MVPVKRNGAREYFTGDGDWRTTVGKLTMALLAQREIVITFEDAAQAHSAGTVVGIFSICTTIYVGYLHCKHWV
jgi:hypothetical protein